MLTVQEATAREESLTPFYENLYDAVFDFVTVNYLIHEDGFIVVGHKIDDEASEIALETIVNSKSIDFLPA